MIDDLDDFIKQAVKKYLEHGLQPKAFDIRPRNGGCCVMGVLYKDDLDSVSDYSIIEKLCSITGWSHEDMIAFMRGFDLGITADIPYISPNAGEMKLNGWKVAVALRNEFGI